MAPHGTRAGPGTEARPYSLVAALSGRVGKPGDTFWLKGGNYGLGRFSTQIAGAPGKPFTFRALPGEKVRIDGSITIWNSIGHVVFRDFELFNSDPKRVSFQHGAGFRPTDITLSSGIECYAPNCSFINLIIHDQVRHGVYVSQRSENTLIYGCLIYNNGWRSQDNAEGHNVYVQGFNGMREISDNILFNSSGAGLHVYDDGGAPVSGMTLEGNTVFHAGALQNVRRYRDWIVGADPPSPRADRIVFQHNMGYLRPGSGTLTQVQMGRSGANGTLTMSHNYLPLGLVLNNWEAATVTENTFAPRQFDYLVELRQAFASSAAEWNNNSYLTPDGWRGFAVNAGRFSFDEWKSVTGYDPASTHAAGPLAEAQVFVRTNRFQPGRASIIIYNWSHRPAVPVDLSAVMHDGAEFEILNAQDYFGAPVLSGSYTNASLTIPMSGHAVAHPLGDLQTPPSTAPEFGVFILSFVPETPNAAPSVSGIPHQSVSLGEAIGPLPFSVMDAETEAALLEVSGSSSNPVLVPNSAIAFGGSETNRTVTVSLIEGITGVATITVSVSDGKRASNTNFVVTASPPGGVVLAATLGQAAGPHVAAGDTISLREPSSEARGTVAYPFTIATTGEYFISALADAPEAAANSFAVNIDAEPAEPEMIWEFPPTRGLEPRIVSWQGSAGPGLRQFFPKVFSLEAGPHQLIVRGVEPNCRLGAITIAPYDRSVFPSVVVTAPVEGSLLAGTFVAAAVATDRDGVAGVLFQMDGADLGPEDRYAPYNAIGDARAFADGMHTLTAIVRDHAGNQAAHAVAVRIANNPPPAFQAPLAFGGAEDAREGGATRTLRAVSLANLPGQAVPAEVHGGSSGEFAIAWRSEAGRTYQIAFKDRLSDSWADSGARITASGAAAAWLIEMPAETDQRFFRIYALD